MCESSYGFFFLSFFSGGGGGGGGVLFFFFFGGGEEGGGGFSLLYAIFPAFTVLLRHAVSSESILVRLPAG